MIDKFTQLGFTPTESLVYQRLIDNGPSFVAPIIIATKKHRQLIYSALDSLAERDLIQRTSKNGKLFYTVNDPDQILIELQQKQLVARQLTKQIHSRMASDQEQIEVITGPDSYEKGMALFRQHIEAAQECSILFNQPKDWFRMTHPYFQEHVDELKRLKRQGIDIFILFSDKDRENIKKYMSPYIGDPYIVKVGHDDNRQPCTIWLAGDHVFKVTSTTDPMVIHIKSKALAEEYRDYFWKVWGSAEFFKG